MVKNSIVVAQFELDSNSDNKNVTMIRNKMNAVSVSMSCS